MTDDYAQYERKCKRIRKENAKLIDQFADWLAAKGLSEATIDKHCDNIDFYLNTFLLYEKAVKPEAGVHEIGMFLGYWFIRKAMWATKASIKSNATSLKKFYAVMLENGKIQQEALNELKEEIKEDMPEWLAALARFDNPDIDDPSEIWGL